MHSPNKVGVILKQTEWLVYVGPIIFLIGILLVYPLGQMFYLSFSKVAKGGSTARFVGLDNYIKVFKTPLFWLVMRNSVIWIGINVFGQFLLGLSAALVLNQKFRLKTFFEIIILLPWVIAAPIGAITWKWMYQPDYGVFNWILSLITGGDVYLMWLGSKTTALPSIILANTWRMFPFPMLMFLAALQAIPKAILEAAEIDGAGRWKAFKYITLPCLRNMIIIVILILTMWALNSFIYVFIMTQGGPANSTEIFGMFIYEIAFRDLNMTLASAVAAILFFAMVLLTFLYLKMINK